MPKVLLNDTHLTVSEDTRVITQDMVEPYRDTVTHITIPEGVTKIAECAFAGYTKLTSVTFPDSLRQIEDRAFACCKGIASITFPDGLSTMENNAFFCCTGLTQVTFTGGSLITIGDFTFFGCTRLTSVHFPESLTTIESYAFSGCVNLQRVIAPPSLAEMGPEYWKTRCIDVNQTKIITLKQLLLDFEKTHDIDKNMSTSQIKTLYLAQEGFIPLPTTRASLSEKIFAGITQLTLENLLTLPIDRSWILPTSAQYASSTPPQSITQAAVLPLYQLFNDAALNIAQWLTWQDMARIQLVKAIRPEAATAAETSPKENHSAAACQQDDIAALADTPAQSTKVFLFSTRHLQNIKLPTLFSRSS